MELSNVKKYFSALYLEDCIGYLGIFFAVRKEVGAIFLWIPVAHRTSDMKWYNFQNSF